MGYLSNSKLCFAVLLLLFLFGCKQKSNEVLLQKGKTESKESPVFVSESDKTELIRIKYREIENGIAGDTFHKSFQEFNCTGRDRHGSLTTYSQKGNPVMLEYVEGIGHSFETTKMYFDQGELFFVFIEDGNWSPAGPAEENGEPGILSTIRETRYYLDSDTIIKKYEKSFEQRSWTKDPGTDKVPNREIASEKGKIYDDEGLADRLKKGITDC